MLINSQILFLITTFRLIEKGGTYHNVKSFYYEANLKESQNEKQINSADYFLISRGDWKPALCSEKQGYGRV